MEAAKEPAMGGCATVIEKPQFMEPAEAGVMGSEIAKHKGERCNGRS